MGVYVECKRGGSFSGVFITSDVEAWHTFPRVMDNRGPDALRAGGELCDSEAYARSKKVLEGETRIKVTCLHFDG